MQQRHRAFRRAMLHSDVGGYRSSRWGRHRGGPSARTTAALSRAPIVYSNVHLFNSSLYEAGFELPGTGQKIVAVQAFQRLVLKCLPLSEHVLGSNSSVCAWPTRFTVTGSSRGTAQLDLFGTTVRDHVEHGHGGAILANGKTHIELTNVSLVRNTAGGGSNAGLHCGGALYASGGTVTIKSSTLSGNSALYSGGAIQSMGVTLTLASSKLSGNSARRASGGAIYAFGGTLTITRTTLSDNMAGLSASLASTRNGIEGGGAIMAMECSVTITSSMLRGNIAGRTNSNANSGGMWAMDKSYIELLNVTFQDNRPDGFQCARTPVFSSAATTTSSTTPDTKTC